MESFWSTLKIELVYRNSWRTRDEAENAIFTYIRLVQHPPHPERPRLAIPRRVRNRLAHPPSPTRRDSYRST
ncbi:IS3 family transposase [Micromonospora sp. WMMB482]|uniref:IS3 family transposase n=1 Tax=Micromonospora sp. WMMB482 TaxID=2849653 RepID=UPI001C2350D7|nr:IS3 family transposase [Micromonospora sp. WMMB482]